MYRLTKDDQGLVQVELFIPCASGLDSPPMTGSECLMLQPETGVFWRFDSSSEVDKHTFAKFLESQPEECHAVYHKEESLHNALTQLKNLGVKVIDTPVKEQLDSLSEKLRYIDQRKTSVLFCTSFSEL